MGRSSPVTLPKPVGELVRGSVRFQRVHRNMGGVNDAPVVKVILGTKDVVWWLIPFWEIREHLYGLMDRLVERGQRTEEFFVSTHKMNKPARFARGRRGDDDDW